MEKELKGVFLEKTEFENQVQSILSDFRNFWRFESQNYKTGSVLIVF